MKFISPDGRDNNKITFSSSYYCYNFLPKQIVMRELNIPKRIIMKLSKVTFRGITKEVNLHKYGVGEKFTVDFNGNYLIEFERSIGSVFYPTKNSTNVKGVDLLFKDDDFKYEL